MALPTFDGSFLHGRFSGCRESFQILLLPPLHDEFAAVYSCFRGIDEEKNKRKKPLGDLRRSIKGKRGEGREARSGVVI